MSKISQWAPESCVQSGHSSTKCEALTSRVQGAALGPVVGSKGKAPKAHGLFHF